MNRANKRILAAMLTLVLVLTQMALYAQAETGGPEGFPSDGGGEASSMISPDGQAPGGGEEQPPEPQPDEPAPPALGASSIVDFAPLEEAVARQKVTIGTSLADLELPDTLTATVEDGDGEQSEADIPVEQWSAAPEYNPLEMGTYLFTPQLESAYTLAEGAAAPEITVQVLMGVAPAMIGVGTKANPLLITSAEQLAEIAAQVNAGTLQSRIHGPGSTDKVYLKLAGNIDLSGYRENGGWTPIGTFNDRFTGDFDGGGFTVTGLYISRTASYQGLFGVIGGDGMVHDLGVHGSVSGSHYTGGVAGRVDGGIARCHSAVTVSGYAYVGGVAGRVDGGGITDSYATGEVSGSMQEIGGVAGQVEGSVTGCYATGTVTGNISVGGVAGTVAGGGSITGSAALNPTVSGQNFVSMGRVAGWSYGALSGNGAFAGMGGKTIWPYTGHDQVDGEDLTADDILADGTIGGRFTGDAWVTETGKLPVLAGLDGQDGTMPGHIAGGDFAGTGTAESPYEIETPAQLARMAELVNGGTAGYPAAHYKLMNDLDLSDYSGGAGWTPIGTSANEFTGDFDGGGHVINRLYIDRSADYQGLFGYIGIGGAIHDLGVRGDVTGSYYVGGVAGHVYGRIDRCWFAGPVSGTSYVGGVAGQVSGSVTDCYATGTVTGGTFVGGVAGYVYGSVDSCYSTVAFTGNTGTNVGGVAGMVGNSGSVTDSAALNPSVGGGANTGRVVGQLGGTASGNGAFDGMGGGPWLNVNHDDLDGADLSATDITGDGTIGSRFDGPTWVAEPGKLPVLAGLGGQDGTIPPYISGTGYGFAGGDGSPLTPYQIATAGQLSQLAQLVEAGTTPYDSAHYILTADIDLSGYRENGGWTPIGTYNDQFTGDFDGDGHVITGLYISRSGTYFQGLFGVIGSGGAVHGLGVHGSVTGGDSVTGGVAGTVYGTIERCHSAVTVRGNQYVGGVAGRVNSGGSITDSYATGGVRGTDWVGGVAGQVDGDVTGCYSTGAVVGSYSQNGSGGVAGLVQSGGGITGSAALNPSVNIVVGNNNGRVAGQLIGSLDSNGAFTGMGGGTWSNNDHDDLDGADLTAADILGDGTIDGRFTGPAWETENGKLPVLAGLGGQDGTMPAHIGGGDFAGDGSVDNPYQIETPAQLVRMAELVNGGTGNYPAAHYKLMNGLDLSAYSTGEGWTPIGISYRNPFTGDFDGGGHVIAGLYIDRSGEYYQGLFGVIGTGGAVHDLGVRGSVTSTDQIVGGVAGDVLSGGSIARCWFAGTVRGSAYVGGVAGRVSGSVADCYATGTVASTNASFSYTGGVAGYLTGSGSVERCYATATVTGGGTHVGGVAGIVNTSGSVTNSAALNPAVTGGTDTGRVAGEIVGSASGNRAFADMPVNSSTTSSNDDTGIHGADMTAQQAVDPAYWRTTMGFDLDAVWEAEQGFLPLLRGLDGQNGDTGLYLTELPQGGLVISPATITEQAGKTVDFTVTGWQDWQHQTIDWTASAGTITPDPAVNGRATLAIPADASGTITVTAASNNDSRINVQAVVTVIPLPVVTFDPTGGFVNPITMRTEPNGRLASLPTPTRAGYTFDGWFTQATGGRQINTATVFNADTTVYAHWTEAGGNPDPNPVLKLGVLGNDTAVVGDDYSKTIAYTYTGSSPLSFQITGLPPTLGYSSATGWISGTPESADVGSYTVAVRVSAGGLTDSGTFALTVTANPEPAVLVMAPLDNDTVTAGYRYAKTPSVTYTGQDTLVYEVTGLPAGLAIDTATGRISGAPTDTGEFDITVTVRENSGSLAHSQSYRLTVNRATGGGGNGGGSTGSGTTGGGRSSGRSSGGSSGGSGWTAPAKTQIPASAFTWDGERTLTIDHERITALGLMGVWWDGTATTAYSVHNGSVIIRFDKDFITEQTPGQHTVRVEFLNHYGETTVTVAAGGEATDPGGASTGSGDTHTPQTGDFGPGPWRWLLALIPAAAITLASAALLWRRLRTEKEGA